MFAVTPVAAFLLTFCTCAVAHNFLAQTQMVAKKDVEQALAHELSGIADVIQLQDIEDMLAPNFKALPKNEHGKLESHVVRYALHRYFIQKHGWFIRGLEFPTTEWDAGSQGVAKDDVPSYIQGIFNRSHGHGLGLRELSIFAATVTDLVHKDAVDSLESMFDLLQLPTVGFVAQNESNRAIQTYLAAHLSGEQGEGIPKTDFRALESSLLDLYPAWTATSYFATDLQKAPAIALQPRRNPFMSHDKVTFETAGAFVQEFGHHFGPFQDLECRRLKNKLVDMEYDGSGRVLLSRFYREQDPDWSFVESIDYLRHLGVLDESDPHWPSVIVPNYVNAVSNCLRTLSFYSVCCLNECEGLVGHLEQELAEPSAAPMRIAEVVSRLPSDTVESPRNLSVSLLARLDEIGKIHAGRVPLHGRLFAQWMHHAYPRECPFPHVAGTVVRDPMTPEEYESSMSGRVLASYKDMLFHLTKSPHSNHEVALPWIHEEELLAKHSGAVQATHAASLLAWVRIAMSLAALSSVTVLLARAARVLAGSKSKKSKDQKYLV